MLIDAFETASARRHKGREVENLLIVTAPRERMVLGCLVLFLLGVVAWAAFGGVDRVVSFDGIIHRPVPEQPWRTTLRIAPTIAQLIDSGMGARIEVMPPGGAALELRGEVVPPAGTPLREEFAARLPWPVDNARRIDIAIVGTDAALPVPEGSPCRVSISLGRQSIASLLSFRPS